MKNFTAAEVLTAADVNKYLANTLVAYKNFSESRTSNTTLTNDAELALAVTPGSYELSAVLSYYGGNGNFKFAFTGPSGWFISVAVVRINPTNGFTEIENLFQTDVVYCEAGFERRAVLIQGFVSTGVSGTVRLQWAQQNSNATPTDLIGSEGTYMRLRLL